MNTIPKPQDMADTARLAKILGTGKSTILLGVKEGRIPVVRVNSRVFRFHVPTVLEALSR